ncbi:MAG: putative quinol monooxygenase [Gaiellaceae bacterium]
MSVHLRICLEPGRADELRSFLREAIPFYESPGGIRVRLLGEVGAPDRFIEIIDYASEDAYSKDEERVKSDATMAQYLARWRALLAEPPIVEVYRDIDTR